MKLRMLVATLCFAALASMAAVAHANRSLVGSYWCQVETSGNIVYAPQRCAIRQTRAGALLFEKYGGSQRFSGFVLPRPEGGFRFSGLFFCPQGACDELFMADFATVDGGFRGSLPGEQTVTVTRRRPSRPATP